MNWLEAGLLASLLLVTACSRSETEPVKIVPDEMLTQEPQELAPAVPSGKALARRDELLRYAGAGSLRSLSRIAKENPDFVSNFGSQEHGDFWDLMRRIGIDPNVKLRQLFEQPAGRREADGEVWYVWPDLAARDARDLIPEKLSFKDRKRLQDLIGDDGIKRIESGEGYPGMRTAIAEDGRWIYFVLGTDGVE